MAFSDAVKLLDGAAPPGWLSRLTGVGAAVVTVATVGAVDLFALRDEVAKWGGKAISGLRERTQGLGRFDRTQRLVAAHSIIVVTAFYDALDEFLTDTPEFDLAGAELTANEQVALSTNGDAARRYADLLTRLIDTPPPMPAPHLPFELVLEDLERHYRWTAVRLHDFLEGLSAFEPAPLRRSLSELRSTELSAVAVRKYEEAYRELAVHAPEFGVWSGMVDGQATRVALAQAVATLRSELTRQHDAWYLAVDSVRAGLSRQHQARMGLSVLSSSDTPPHVTIPTLTQAYVNPRGLIGTAGPADLPATEAWWKDKPRVLDVPDFLLGHLTGAAALEQPVVVLGQPGSGKSVLTEVLAAQLPDTSFMVVRVELRKVHSDSSVQQQIERSLYQTLGETVTWPDLVRRAHLALPVVIMDGFDELLQATGVNRADYLAQLREFQQREADLGRPVAVLVTSRTVVADRARFPHDTVVIRLEPFDDEQIATWLDVWNNLNEPGLHQRGLRTLPAETAVQYGDLARQPLLLLLLVLYDAGANALQKTAGGIDRTELYERLFADFVAREVDKHDPNDSSDRRRAAIDAEWRRLSAVGLAILNRGGDVIAETDLDDDMHHLLIPEDWGTTRSESVNRALTIAQLLIGRFFFVHQSQASRGTDAPERSFEFLHATFGEFLAARQIINALTDLAAEHAHQRRRPGAVLDVGFLYTATSFITIARRAPLWEFCRGFIDQLGADERDRCRHLVLELLPDAGFPHPTWSLAEYEPRRKPTAARHATYSANLACLAVLLASGPVDVAELVGEPTVTRWRAQALLWQSQLDTEDRRRLWQTMRVSWDLSAEPTVLYVRVEDGAPVSVYQSLPWPADERPKSTMFALTPDVSVPSESTVGRALRRSAFVQAVQDSREHLYALMPYWRIYGDTTAILEDDTLISNGGALLELLLQPIDTTHQNSSRVWLYFRALQHVSTDRQRRPILGQLLRDAIHLRVDEMDEILEPWTNTSSEEENTIADLARELSRIAEHCSSPEELDSEIIKLSRRNLRFLKLLMGIPTRSNTVDHPETGS
jgi:predicted kinase